MRRAAPVTAFRSAMAILVLTAVSCSDPAATPFRPVAETKVLMQAVLDPNADEIWDSAGEILTPDGVEDLRPKNDEQWTAVRNHAVTLTEAGNLLMMAPRAADGGQWMTLARALVDAGEACWRAADAKDADRLLNAGDALYATCVNCHEKYMPANR